MDIPNTYTLENPVTRERADLAVDTVCAYYKRTPASYAAPYPNGDLVEEVGLLARLLAEEVGLSDRDCARHIGISHDALRHARGRVEAAIAAGDWMVTTAHDDLARRLARAEARARRRQIALQDPDGHRRARLLAALDRRDAIVRPDFRALCRAAATQAAAVSMRPCQRRYVVSAATAGAAGRGHASR